MYVTRLRESPHVLMDILNGIMLVRSQTVRDQDMLQQVLGSLQENSSKSKYCDLICV